jgi:hypothetical protein
VAATNAAGSLTLVPQIPDNSSALIAPNVVITVENKTVAEFQNGA